MFLIKKRKSADTQYLLLTLSLEEQKVFKLDVLKNFVTFTRKPLWWTPTQVFSCEYCEICKNSLFYRTTANLLSTNHPVLWFWLSRGGRQMPIIINFTIRRSYPKSYNELLGSHFPTYGSVCLEFFPR